MSESFPTGAMHARRNEVLKQLGMGADIDDATLEKTEEPRWVTAKVVFEAKDGSKVPAGARGKYVKSAVDGDEQVVWVSFPGFGMSVARVGKAEEAVI